MDRQPSENSYEKSQETTKSWTSDVAYDVNPGVCVIINNMTFQGGIPNLKEGKKDEDRLNVIFTTLGFDVQVHQNLTGQEMKSCAESYSHKEHTGAFFLAILSHGCLDDNLPAVVGTDGVRVKVFDLECYFHATNCPSLAGIPKIFLIDACRGSNIEPFYSSKEITEYTQLKVSKLEIADSADFIIIYASTQGNVAFMLSEGSVLTQTFSHVLFEATCNQSLQEITQEVQRRVKESGKKQTVEVISRLDKNYYIKRNTLMAKFQELPIILWKDINNWIPVRNKTIQEVKRVAEELTAHHKILNTAQTAGTSAAIGGGVLAVVGIGLVPFTFGASLSLTNIGIVAAVAGGTVTATATAINAAMKKSKVTEVQEHIQRDYHQLRGIQELATKINTIISDTQSKCSDVDSAVFTEVITEIVSQRRDNINLKVADLAVTDTLKMDDTEGRIGSVAAKSIVGIGTGLNVVLTSFDIIEIVQSSLSLSKESQTKAVERLYETARELEQQKAKIQQQAGV